MTDKNLKIMQVLGAKGSGGAEMFFLRLAKALYKKVDLLCVVREGSWIQSQLDLNKIPYKTAPFGGFFDLKTKCLLKKYIKAFNPDVVQGWMNRACSKLPKTNATTVGRLGGYYNLKNYKNCDYLVANTKDLQEFIVTKGHPADKTFYIPNFSPAPDEKFKEHKISVRYQYKIPENAKVLFIAGRLHHVKGIDLAILGLRSLPENVHLLVAGDGKLKGELEAQARHEGVEGRVHLAGWVNNVTMLAAAADLWLVPSRQETLGNVVLDAWSHKVPVVASKTQGPIALIEHDITGKLFDIEDVDTMVRHVDSLLKSPKVMEDMVEKGYDVIQSYFSEDVVVEKYTEFYKQVKA